MDTLAARVFFVSVVALASACHRDEVRRQVPYNVTVSTGTDFTVLRAAFTDPSTLAWSSPDCVGVRVLNGNEPPSLAAGRVNVWVPSGDVIGHVDFRPPGFYQAQVRGLIPPGTRIAASVAGTNAVPRHRFQSAPTVPAPVQRLAPDAGFALRPDAPLRVTWEGGDSSHVAILLLAAHGAPETATATWMVSCVVPRSPMQFTIPAAALSRVHIPAGADSVSVAVTADDRVIEGDFALDVTPVGTAGDIVTGTVGP